MRTSLIKSTSVSSLFPWLSLIWLPIFVQAQNAPQGVADWLNSYRGAADFEPIELFVPVPETDEQNRPIEQAFYLNMSHTAAQKIQKNKPLNILLSIPRPDQPDLVLELAQSEPLAPGFSVGTLGDAPKQNLPIATGLHYRGIIKGNPQSLVAISIFPDEVMGMICNAQGTYTLGKLSDGSGRHLLYDSRDIERPETHQCFTDLLEQEGVNGGDLGSVSDRGVGCKTVQIYFECDYQMYLDRGSNTQNVVNYVTGLFNQVATLYANDNIGVAISEIYVWTAPDPHRGQSSTSGVLNSFRSARGTNFNGHLAHFLSTRNLGGGVAYVDVICAKSYAFGVSGISNTYQNVPTYSWSVEVLTHELGHNLGSWHTQSCNWTGGPIDNCVQQEGNCAAGPPPVNGGTIMSYCHLTNAGINFNHGFGPKPGQRIRDRVLAASCLPQTGNAPLGLSTTNVTGSSATLNWGAVPGATNYTVNYKTAASTTWVNGGSSSSSTLNLNGLLPNTAYNWQVKTDCSNFSTTANFTTAAGGGSGNCNAPSGHNISNLTSTSANLNWTAVSGASQYTVQHKTANSSTWITTGTVTGTSIALSGLSAATTYNWQVKANCSGYASGLNFTTNNNSNPTNCNAPSALSTTNLSSSSARLNWGAVSGASSYTVQFKTTAASFWNTAGSTTALSYNLTNLAPNTNYQWRVKANCSAYSVTTQFTTPGSGGGSTCTAPSNLTNVSVGNTWAVIRWTAPAGAVNYTLQIRTSNSSTYITLGTVGSTQVTLNGMTPGISYYWRVKANCSAYAPEKLLTALPNLDAPGLGRSPELVQLALSPNPAHDWLQLRYGGLILPNTRLQITDATGRQLLEQGFMLEYQQVDISSLPNGLYYLILRNEDGILASEPFLKL